MRLLLVVLFVLGRPTLASAQVPEVEKLREELRLEKLFATVDPVVHEFQRLAPRRQNLAELGRLCGDGYVSGIHTRVGQAVVYCAGDGLVPDLPDTLTENERYLESAFGNRTVSVTIYGYSTHTQLCPLSYLKGAHLDPLRVGCVTREKFPPVVVARLTVKNRVSVFDAESVEVLRRLNDEAPIHGWKELPKAGDLVGIVTYVVTEPKYEFPQASP